MKRSIHLFLIGVVALSVAITVIVFSVRALTYTPPLCDGCNVILITLDATTAEAFFKDDTPFTNTRKIVDERGVSFDHAYTPAVFSYPVLVSLFTGTYPWKYSIWDYHVALPYSATTLAETLTSYGYTTAGFVRGPFMDEAWGLAQGFSIWRTGDASVPEPPRVSFDEARSWIQKADGPYFVYIKPFSVYDLFGLPDASTGFSFNDLKQARAGDATGSERLRNGYATAMKEIDALLSSFLTDVTRKEGGRKTVVIITGTYGQELLLPTTRDQVTVSLPSAQALNVPLTLLIPSVSPKRIVRSVETRSVATTITQIVSGAKSILPGTSLVPYIKGNQDNMRVYAYVPLDTTGALPEIPENLSTIVQYYKKEMSKGPLNKTLVDVAYTSLEGSWQVIRAGTDEFVFNVGEDMEGKKNLNGNQRVLWSTDGFLVRDLFFKLMQAL